MSLKNLKKRGFTLIELMIVVAIIGILAAVAIPKFSDLVTRSKESSVKGALGAIRSAVSIYYSDTEGEFPSDLLEGLTNGSKYLPQIGGQPALGRFPIPRVTSTANPGHARSAGFELLDDTSEIRNTTQIDPVDNNTQGINYASGGTAHGELVLNCTHLDTKSTVWTAY